MEFGGRVALVTGTSSGIGQAFGLAGARVAVAARREEEGEQTAALIRDRGTDAFFVKCDVTDPKEVERLVAETVRRYGRLDACCNNAGVLKSSSVVNLDRDDWDQVLDVNLKGMWLYLKYEISQMLIHGT